MIRQLVLVLCAASALLAQKIDGDWLYTMPSPNGEVTATLTLKSDGETLTGTFAFTETRKLAIQDGTIKGKEFKMKVKRDRPEGGSVVYEMTGTWDGNEIKGSSEAEMFGQKAKSEWTAKRK